MQNPGVISRSFETDETVAIFEQPSKGDSAGTLRSDHADSVSS